VTRQLKHRKQRESASVPAPFFHRAPPALLVACFFVAVAFALYWGALRNPPVFDDQQLRVDALRHFAAQGFSPDFRWLAYATFGRTYEIIGMQWAWHRAVNVLLHAMTALLLFSFLERVFGWVRAPGPAGAGDAHAKWMALFAALIFLLHPAAVYGVAYLVQRSIIMATLFGLLCLRLFLEGLIRASLPYYLAAVAAYLLAVLSKEHSVMLPAVAGALAFLVRGPSLRLLRELAVPAALFAVIGLLVVLKAKGYLGAPYETFAPQMVSRFTESGSAPVDDRLYLLSVINQGLLFFKYLLVWWVPYTGWMSIDVRPAFPAGIFSWPHTVGFAAYLAYPVLAASLLARGGSLGLLGFGLLYPWLLALTEMAAVRLQEPFVLYRSYLWMSGLTVAVVALLWRVDRKRSYSLLGAACVALILPLQDRLDSFSSGLKLWDDVVRKNTDASAPFVERGYHNRGLAFLQAKQYPDALRDFDRALEINPRDASALVGRGTLFARTGSFDRALADLGRAIEVDPGYAESYAKRCFVKMLLEEPRNALPDCEMAVELDPRHRDAHTNLGVVLAALNRAGEAEASYRRALAIEPSNGDANYNYGVLLAALGRREEARDALTRACDARIASACEMLNALARPRGVR
jgi:Tfp pilus assembly protein PilF